jgi:nucleotide-binding universal stress UspA family protein
MRILFATDGSAGSEAALAELVRRPWPKGSRVLVTRVDPPLDASPFGGEARSVFDDLVQRQREEAARHLRLSADALRAATTGLTVTSCLLSGRPVDEIVRKAEEWQADLIMIGSQGRSAIGRLLLGSVSHGVVTRAPCSVEVVREPARRRAIRRSPSAS